PLPPCAAGEEVLVASRDGCRPLPPCAAGEEVLVASRLHSPPNFFTCRTRRQGSSRTSGLPLAAKLLHLPAKPAGVVHPAIATKPAVTNHRARSGSNTS